MIKMITINDLEKNYNGSPVLNNLSITFDSKGIDIIVGVNGSGKTTLLNCICDITSFQKGDIKINSVSRKEKEAKLKMFYIPSDFYLPEYLSGNEYADFIFRRYKDVNKELFEFITEMYHLTSFLDEKISNYSYGMKKKLQIGIALALKIEYVLADEVFNGLDYESYLLTEYLIKKYSALRKFILISHNMDFIMRNEQANIYLLSKGTLSTIKNVGDIEGIVINNGELQKYYEKIDGFISRNKSLT
ncbi:ABC transporter ATP-binding protein [Bacillus sp. NMCN6]|nr:ABC transporter ATP-binding protein [Bacillus sp. NMCN1]PRR97006.1 ABC transporter ATP-binding protein [Bacillus sp. NMCN6]